MLSPAARHRQKVLAAQAAATAPSGLAVARPETGPEATEYELLRAQLGAHLAQLRDIQSVETKIARKAQLIEEYDPHVNATLIASAQTGKAVQDVIVSTMMIWRFDIGDFPRGLDLAEHVLYFGLDLPENIKRTPATLIAEEVAEAALRAVQTDQMFSLETINRALSITDGRDMPDQVRAKLHKARARLLLREAEKAAKDAEGGSAPAGAERAAQAEALASFQRAYGLDKGCGVKKDIERLAAKVGKSPE